ncbi:hypothetical protein AQUCO_02300039v1 [Aquilegia coerulea]|uniref:NAC domain-containing protein n=1 Tax=Aquilegia coerulea TaxID=218851 RepID=A0A2G5DBV6_AQUCA|nr:hypothetical protein AQUCO_02300039v1 [Aquilegia coerulea]
MEAESCVPPGFRFYPTEEELVGYYLKRKVDSKQIEIDVITDIDLYRIEPWDIQDRCKLGCEEKNEWYFFSHKDKKYPTGTRTNRATAAGFWKATGRDKAVLSKHRVIGMRKTLVFYKGRAPNGKKTDWIMHEYRLQTSEDAPPQDEGWVVCRAFKKPSPSHKQRADAWNHTYFVLDAEHFGHQAPADFASPSSDPYQAVNFHQQSFGCEDEIGSKLSHFENQLIELPQLQSPSLSTSLATKEALLQHNGITNNEYEQKNGSKAPEFIDWKTVDKLLASQLTEMASSTQSNLPLNHHQDYYVDSHSSQGNSLLDYLHNL